LVGRHQLIKAFSRHAAEEVFRGRLVAVELQRVRVHPFVADARDWAPRQLRRMKVVSGRLRDQQTAESIVLLRRFRIGDDGGAAMIMRVITNPTESHARDSSSATMAMLNVSSPLPP